jgi:hypothetical protein
VFKHGSRSISGTTGMKTAAFGKVWRDAIFINPQQKQKKTGQGKR